MRPIFLPNTWLHIVSNAKPSCHLNRRKLCWMCFSLCVYSVNLTQFIHKKSIFWEFFVQSSFLWQWIKKNNKIVAIFFRHDFSSRYNSVHQNHSCCEMHTFSMNDSKKNTKFISKEFILKCSNNNRLSHSHSSHIRTNTH